MKFAHTLFVKMRQRQETVAKQSQRNKCVVRACMPERKENRDTCCEMASAAGRQFAGWRAGANGPYWRNQAAKPATREPKSRVAKTDPAHKEINRTLSIEMANEQPTLRPWFLDLVPLIVVLLIAAHVFALVYWIYRLATEKQPQRRKAH
ncbi:hypothetical protein CISIN_1g044409mg [Citrus sinensis]|uniref:Uncharacterized protein n=2 Tax=Citrus TaxID=2706 RepID=A0A067FV99_CITSI|nr:hypothetical protein CISIN_1g044409mg [Citrus sinensis]